MKEITKMKREYLVAREREIEKLMRMKRATESAGKGLIKKLELKKGKKYILFFPKTAGLTSQDLANIPLTKELSGINFAVESSEGIIAIEK